MSSLVKRRTEYTVYGYPSANDLAGRGLGEELSRLGHTRLGTTKTHKAALTLVAAWRAKDKARRTFVLAHKPIAKPSEVHKPVAKRLTLNLVEHYMNNSVGKE